MIREINILTSALTIVLVFAVCSTFAQTNYLPGFIITTQGDTLRGEVDYRNWDSSPVKVVFRKSASSEIQQYTVANAKAFSVGNEFYESATIDVDTSAYKIAGMDEVAAPKYKRQKVFLQYLMRGEKSLLLYKPDTEQNHFYIIIDGQFHPLVHKQYFLDQSTKKIAENNGYQKLLVAYLIECKSLPSRIVNIHYEKKALFQLFKNYYECTNREYKHIDERKLSELSYGVIAGATVSEMTWHGNSADYMQVDYQRSINPAAGFFFDFKLLRSRRFSINNDVLLTFFDIKYKGPFGNNAAYEVDSQFKYTYLKTNHVLRYNVLYNGALYVGAGGSFGLALKYDNHIITHYGNPALKTEQNIQESPIEFGLIGAVGTGWDKWRLEAKYENSSGVGYHSPTNTARGYLVLKYRIK